MNAPVEPPAPPAPSPAVPSDPWTLWLRRGDQLFVGTLIVVALCLMGLYWVRLQGWGQLPIEIDRLPVRQYDYQLEINQAPWFEWTLLEGIGEKLARRIVAFRDANGPFKTIADVRRVPGIGPQTWEQIRPWLTLNDPSTVTNPPVTNPPVTNPVP